MRVGASRYDTHGVFFCGWLGSVVRHEPTKLWLACGALGTLIWLHNNEKKNSLFGFHGVHFFYFIFTSLHIFSVAQR